MKLLEHPDFEQAIVRAAEHFKSRGLRPALIEKDYYITEALRALVQEAGDKVIFKGGTSLSKGWNLIERFSEDIASSSIHRPIPRRSAPTPSTAISRSCAMQWRRFRLPF